MPPWLETLACFIVTKGLTVLGNLFHCQNVREISKYHLKEIKQGGCAIKTENELLLSRFGIFGKTQTQYSICEEHRDSFGVSFVKQRMCQHPSHLEKKRKSKIDLSRSISLEMSKDIHNFWNVVVPIGEGKYV